MSTKIDTKEKFYKLWDQGKLGNRPRLFASLEEAISFPTRNTISIRSKIPNSQYTDSTLEIPQSKLLEVYNKLLSKGVDPNTLVYSEDFPPHCNRLLNADVWRGVGGLYINYSYLNKPLRKAINEDGRHATNTAAYSILKHCLDNSSYEFLEYLLDEYEDHVIEISSWDVSVGMMGWNSIIWEVRLF